MLNKIIAAVALLEGTPTGFQGWYLNHAQQALYAAAAMSIPCKVCRAVRGVPCAYIVDDEHLGGDSNDMVGTRRITPHKERTYAAWGGQFPEAFIFLDPYDPPPANT